MTRNLSAGWFGSRRGRSGEDYDSDDDEAEDDNGYDGEEEEDGADDEESHHHIWILQGGSS